MPAALFDHLYSAQQTAQFIKVRDALVADPKALDNRGDAADSVAAIDKDHAHGNS